MRRYIDEERTVGLGRFAGAQHTRVAIELDGEPQSVDQRPDGGVPGERDRDEPCAREQQMISGATRTGVPHACDTGHRRRARAILTFTATKRASSAALAMAHAATNAIASARGTRCESDDSAAVATSPTS